MRRKLRFSLAGIVSAAMVTAGMVAPATATEPSPTDDVVVAESIAEDLELDTVEVVVGEADPDGLVVPVEAADGLTVPTAGDDDQETVTIGLPADSTAQLIEGDSVVYDAEADAAGLVVQALDTSDLDEVSAGVMTLITIAGPEADSRYEFPLEVPEGARVEFGDDGAVVVLNADDEALGVFPTPWAVDAEGSDLRTWYEVEGTTLVQHIDHDGAAYPVIADPVWFVPVVVVGARVAVHIAVRASTASAARTAAVRAAAAQTGKAGVRASGTAVKATYKSLTKSNYRHNLVVRTGKNPLKCQAHHTMPQAMADRFQRLGINVHDPLYLLWWVSAPGEPGNHQSKASAYNSDWTKFFRDNPNATRAQALTHRTTLVNKYRSFYKC